MSATVVITLWFLQKNDRTHNSKEFFYSKINVFSIYSTLSLFLRIIFLSAFISGIVNHLYFCRLSLKALFTLEYFFASKQTENNIVKFSYGIHRRGKLKAESETALLYMAYNMRRAINMVGIRQRVAAWTETIGRGYSE